MQDPSRPMAPRPPRPEPTKEAGTRIGPYELVHELATGGMGSVWAAREGAAPGRLVAIKRVKKQLVSRAGMAARFEEAVRAAARIEHPSLCRTLEFLLHEGEPCVVSELLEAETLKALIRASATHRMPIPARVSLRIVLDILGGLAASHERSEGEGAPALHGDLSPENILVTTAGQAKIIDYGLAKPLVGTLASPLRSREKAGYQAPEQIKSPASADLRADLFAVGVLLWELATGERLFESKYEAAVAQKVLAAPIARLDALGKATAEVAKVVARALERDPSQRFASAVEMTEALSAAASGEIATADEVAIVVDNLAGPQLAQRKRAIQAAIAKLDGTAPVSPAKTPAPTPKPPVAAPTPRPPAVAPTPKPPPVIVEEERVLEVDDLGVAEDEDDGLDVVIDEEPPVSNAQPAPPAAPEVVEPVVEAVVEPVPAAAPLAEMAVAAEVAQAPESGPVEEIPEPSSSEREAASEEPSEAAPPESATGPVVTEAPMPAPAADALPPAAPMEAAPAPSPAPGDVVVADSIVIAKEAFEAPRPAPAVAPPIPVALPEEDEDELALSQRVDPRRARRLVFGIVGAAAGLLLFAVALTTLQNGGAEPGESALPAEAIDEAATLKAALPLTPEPAAEPAPEPEAVVEPAPEPEAEAVVEPAPEPEAEAVVEPAPEPVAAPEPPPAAAEPAKAPAARPVKAAPAKPRKPAKPKPAPKAFDPSSI